MSNKFFVKYKWDNKFLLFIIILVIIGIVMVYSSSYFEIGYKGGDQNALIKKELLFATFGLFSMWIISKVNYKLIRKITVPLNIIALSTYILLLPALNMSLEFRGARRWVALGGFQFMPSDIAKYAAIISIAYLLSMNKKERKQKIKNRFLAICPIIYIYGTFKQPDISTTAVIIGSIVALFFIAGMDLRLLFGSIVSVFFLGVFYIMRDSVRIKRVESFINPFLQPTGDGYQVIQSLVAIASGGLGGVGLGNSRQKMLYLPLAYNDYIFAIYAEELGFIGSIILVAVFTALIFRGFKIISNAPDKFSTLLASGIIAQIALQTIVNLFVSANLIPSTGINLPIISYGGTSLVTTLAALGVVLGISRFENKVVPVAYKPVQEKRYHSLESRDRR